MKIHKGIDSFKKLSKAVVTTGTFDGVHLGHDKILNKLISVGCDTGAETVLITFFPHPRIVLFPDQELKLINTIEENISLFKKYNIDHLIFQNFDKAFSRITSLQYIRDFLCQKVGLKDLILGYNHHFGRNREGSKNELEEYADIYNFNIHEVDPFYLDKVSISSTKIRESINSGCVDLSNTYLGYNFKLSGHVIYGNGVGKDIGFPTANIKIENTNKILPAKGAYAVYVTYGNQKLKAMLNIGFNPTFSNKKVSIEVNIFDFNQNIYGEFLTIEFIQKIRNEKKFQTVNDLQNQLSLDKVFSLNILD